VTRRVPWNVSQVHPHAFPTHRRQSSIDLFTKLDHMRNLSKESTEGKSKLSPYNTRRKCSRSGARSVEWKLLYRSIIFYQDHQEETTFASCWKLFTTSLEWLVAEGTSLFFI